MVAQPTFSGGFDGDIATLNPQVAICDVTNGPDVNCGGSAAGATPAVLVFTTTSTPAITLDPTTPQYQVNWDTQGAGFLLSHTYRVHVTAGASGTRRELGFADALLTTVPGQAKNAETGDIVVLQDGRTLPIHFRIETRIPGSLAVSAATASVTSGGTDLITATVKDLHGALLAGATVVWSVTTTPASGVADATQPLSPTSGPTGTAGTTATTFKAGTTSGTATITATSAGLSATVSVSIVAAIQTITLSSGNGAIGSRDPANQFTLDGGVNFQDAFIIVPNPLYSIIPGTQWISSAADGNGVAFGTVRFRRSFVLPQGFHDASLSVDVHADNVASVFLNGMQIGQQPFAAILANFQDPPSTFTATDPVLFRAGTNVLEFDITNLGGPGPSFDYKAVVSFRP
jgi:hypothetical protein